MSSSSSASLAKLLGSAADKSIMLLPEVELRALFQTLGSAENGSKEEKLPASLSQSLLRISAVGEVLARVAKSLGKDSRQSSEHQLAVLAASYEATLAQSLNCLMCFPNCLEDDLKLLTQSVCRLDENLAAGLTRLGNLEGGKNFLEQ